MRRFNFCTLTLLVGALCMPWLGNAGLALGQASPADAIPPELRPWQGWALQGSEFLRCPYISGLNAQEPGSRICHWIGTLRIDANAGGATFRQAVTVFANGWIAVPGDAERWPQDVRVDGGLAAVVARNGRPMLWIERAGTYFVTGEVPWPRLPDSLAVPANAGIVTLSVAGQPLRDPEFANGAVRLGTQTVRAVTEANSLDIRIHRKLSDTLPGQLETRLTLHVAGQAREAYIGPILPDGFVPMSLQTPLPARLEPDGRLRVQVRPGTWSVGLRARAAGLLDTVTVPTTMAAKPSETWSFEASDRLRVASLEGATALDPAQANVPPEWQLLPAFNVPGGSELRIVERSRGLEGQDLNRLSVERQLWLDFSSHGYTFRDEVSGQMQQTWRLDMLAPYQLQGARSFEQPLLVTRGSRSGRTGVEWRTPDVQLEATGRVETSGSLLASGWDMRLADLAVTLHLPPGHRLLAALGADSAPSAWLNRWQLLDIFIVLLVVAAAFRIAGAPAAALAALALLLAHHEQHALTWLFLNLLVAIATVSAVPAGRFTVWARLWRNISFALVLVALIPFTLYQARLAFFPQLEAATAIPWSATTVGGAMDAVEMQDQEVASEPMPADARNAADEAQVDAGRLTKSVPMSASPPAPSPLRARASGSVYATGTVLQSGPGVPEWTYNVHALGWSGPVEPTQSLRLVVLGPLALSAWRLLGCLLLAAFLALLLRESYGLPRWPLLERWMPRRAAVVATALGAITLASLASPAPAHAQTPAPEILQELQQRLSQPPACAPECVAIASATLRVLDDSMLEIELETHAQTRAVLALPAATRYWTIESVSVIGDVQPAVGRDDAGRAIVALEPGVRRVTLRGRLAAADSVRIAFPQRPARVRVEAGQWLVTGIDEGRLLADSLTLTRRPERGDAAASDTNGAGRSERLATDEFPPFVRVIRRLTFGLDGWSALTTVARLAPEQGAFTVQLPLLAGESVLTANLPVRNGAISISMPADVTSVQWQSAVAIVPALSLQAPGSASWVEVWELDPNPIWRLSFTGTPEIYGDSSAGDRALHRFEPRSGEKLELAIARPEAADGASVTFERIRQRVDVGQRSRDTSLQIAYRSTQGGRHELGLPEAARLTSVLVDGQALALRLEDGKLVLPLQPGSHEIGLTWQMDAAPSFVTRSALVTLGAPASNVTTTINLPETRWVLFAGGDGVGPAVLYWAELVVFIALAVLLGRLTSSPLRTVEWLLVGLGLSTFSWSVLLLFAGWVFAVQWRRSWSADVQPWVFNAVQVGLVVLTVVALGSLIAAIPNGLLGTPDMRITGAVGGDGLLSWFHDRVESVLPQPAVVSVSIWFYKVAMLGWALWLSFALVRWVRTAWQAFTAVRVWYNYTDRPLPPGEQPTNAS